MIFYIESNGFCATQWLSTVLNSVPGVQCFHGTRDPHSGAALGSPTDLPADAFVAELARLSSTPGVAAGAIHGKFGPEMGQLVRGQGGHYGLGVRHPVTRVNSCAAWARNKVDSGVKIPLSVAVEVCTALFKSDFGADEVIFAFAIMHILDHDSVMLYHQHEFDNVYRMEDYTADPAALGQLMAAATGRAGGDLATIAGMLKTGAVNVHSGHGSRSPEGTWAAWSDKRRRLFAKLMEVLHIAERGHYGRIGYDIGPFLDCA